MAKKTKNPLLKEGTIRRMMKLANMETVGDTFLSEKFSPLDEEDLHEENPYGGGKGNIKAADRKKYKGDKTHGGKGPKKLDSAEAEGETDYRKDETIEPIAEEDELERELDATEDELGAEDSFADEEASELDTMGADEVEAEVTVGDADVESLKTARDVLDQVISAAGEGDAGEEMDMEELPGEEVEEIGAEVEDLEEPGARNDMDLYEAALSGLGVELVDDKAEKLKAKLEEVKQRVYKRVVKRLLKETKK